MQKKQGKTLTIQAWSVPALWETFHRKVIGRRFVRDVGVLTIANIAGVVMNFIQAIVVARWLEPELYGLAALVLSYPNLVYAFLDARSAEVSVKYLSEFYVRREDNQFLEMCHVGYMIDLAVGLLAFFVILVTAHWAAQNVAHTAEMTGLMIVFGASFIPQSFVGTSYAILATLRHFRIIAKIHILETTVRVGLLLSLVLTGWEVTGIVLAHIITTTVTGLLYGFTAWRVMRLTWQRSPLRVGWPALKSHRKEIFRFLIYNNINALLGMIPKQLDVVLLGYFRNSTEVGYYKLAMSIASMAGYLVRPLQTVTYTDMARLFGLGHREALRQQVWRLTTRIGLPSGLISIAAAGILPFVLPSLVGNRYAPAAPAAQILLVGSAIYSAFFWLRPVFLACGWIRQWMTCFALFAFCNLIGWLVIVPKEGYLGMSAWRTFSIIATYTTPTLIVWMMKVGHEKSS